MAVPRRSRINRGRETEFILAEYLQAYWPEAHATGKSAPGDDIVGTGVLAIEAKATAHNPILPALRQAHGRAREGQIPVVIWRPNGFGPANVADWVVATRVSTFFGPLAFRADYFKEKE
jgi:hypothetical protein